MRKYLLSLLFYFAAISLVASDHLSFMGIPITGDISTFNKKLKTKGFSIIEESPKLTIFKGEFIGRESIISVVASSKGTDVFAIVVMFNESNNWKFLVNEFNYCKDLYSMKYGEPSKLIENNPSHLDSNTSRMLALYEDKVEYKAEWNLPEGDILIWIEKAPLVKGNVIIRYINSQHLESNIQKDLEDI